MPLTALTVTLCAGSGERPELPRSDTDAASRTPSGVPPVLALCTEPLSYTNDIGFAATFRHFNIVGCGRGLRCPASRKRPNASKVAQNGNFRTFVNFRITLAPCRADGDAPPSMV